MNLKKTKIFAFIILLSTKSISQEIKSDDVNLNNRYWRVINLKAKKINREALFKSSDEIPEIEFKKGVFLFSNDSLVLAMSCDTNNVVSGFKFKQTDIVELFGIDYNVNYSNKLTFKEPSLRRFNHFTFSFKFKIKKIRNSDLLLKCKKPNFRLVLRHLADYKPNEPVKHCDDLNTQ